MEWTSDFISGQGVKNPEGRTRGNKILLSSNWHQCKISEPPLSLRDTFSLINTRHMTHLFSLSRCGKLWAGGGKFFVKGS